MARRWSGLALGLGGVFLLALAPLSTPAQQPPENHATATVAHPAGTVSVQEALLRPFDFPFDKDTPISEVAEQLSKALHAPVVLDRAAMGRLDVRPDDTVRLELHGVRLKTGLRLLLDQLDMTYRVEAEDNLLIFTDSTGAADSVNKILSEIEALHRDMHSLQNAVDSIRAAMGIDEEGAKVRKPTIIEELPQPRESKPGTKPKSKPPVEEPVAPRSRPGV